MVFDKHKARKKVIITKRIKFKHPRVGLGGVSKGIFNDFFK